MKIFTRLVTFYMIIFLFTPLAIGQAAPLTQTVTPEDSARLLLAQLTPEEKVGQLFIVTFKGASADPRSQVYDLIVNRHIGGVVLWAQNDNFLGTDQTLPIALNLNRQLQAARMITPLRWTSPKRLVEIQSVLSSCSFHRHIPGRRQLPIRPDVERAYPLPSQMAIGATWNPTLAQQVGNLVGAQLSSIWFQPLIWAISGCPRMASRRGLR